MTQDQGKNNWRIKRVKHLGQLLVSTWISFFFCFLGIQHPLHELYFFWLWTLLCAPQNIWPEFKEMNKWVQGWQHFHPFILYFFIKASQRLLQRRSRYKQTLSMNILQKQTLLGEPVSARPSVSTHKLALTIGLGDLGLVRQKQRPTQTKKYTLLLIPCWPGPVTVGHLHHFLGLPFLHV